MAVEDPHGIDVRCQQSECRERANRGNELFGRTHRRGNVVANRAGNEHVGGIGGAFHPKGTLTRAQLAAILQRLSGK